MVCLVLTKDTWIDIPIILVDNYSIPSSACFLTLLNHLPSNDVLQLLLSSMDTVVLNFILLLLVIPIWSKLVVPITSSDVWVNGNLPMGIQSWSCLQYLLLTIHNSKTFFIPILMLTTSPVIIFLMERLARRTSVSSGLTLVSLFISFLSLLHYWSNIESPLHLRKFWNLLEIWWSPSIHLKSSLNLRSFPSSRSIVSPSVPSLLWI